MDRDEINLNSELNGSLSVDAILAEYEAEHALFGEAEKKPEPEEPDSARRIVYDSSEQAIIEAVLTSDGLLSEAEPLIARAQEPEIPELSDESERLDEAELLDEPVLQPVFEYEPRPEPIENAFREISVRAEEPLFEEPPPTVDELIAEAAISDEDTGEYAAPGDYERGYEREDDGDTRRYTPQPDFREKVVGPLVGLMAAAAQRREERQREAQKRREAEKKEQPPELKPDRASAFYEAQAQSLKTRGIFASAVTIVLLYLSFGLPAVGLLGASPTIKALVCLVLELVVLVIGLDVFSNGLLTLFRGKAGAESLVSVACIASVADAAYIAATGNVAVGLPFCGAAALAVTFALWGNYFSCMAYAISFFTASRAETPTVVLSLSGVDEEGCVLAKAKRPVTGFVRSAETSDGFESAYRLAAPVLIAGSVILSLFVYFASDKCDSLIHTLAAATAACASLSAVFGFAFPFYVLSKRLAKSGVAIAGYSGAADLGRIRRVLVSDADMFPPRTLSIADVSISESARPGTVISYTGSMIAAAGLGIAPVFTELMRKNGCTMQRVEDFACHEGGGLVARINGDLVYVGTSAFMQLMGVRLPRGTSKTSAVYTAINDSLTGIISVSYKPVASVQRALVTLLRGRSEPLFAIRDFNITPLLVKQKFRLPLDSYNFPSFADRYRISSPIAEDGGTVAAMFARGGLNSVAGLAKRGRGLYNRLRIGLALSILGAFFGLVFMLMLCWTGAYDSAGVGNLILYMLLWLVPTLVMSAGLRN